MDVKGDKMVAADYTPVSKVSQHLKDVRIMLDEAESPRPAAAARERARRYPGRLRYGTAKASATTPS